MHRISRQFATRKPAFWCQKYEYQDDHTQKIPLPGVSRVIPEEDLLQCGNQASHVLTLASKQPQDAWLAGR
jgi:ribosomal protein S12 methylthiotransferase accessory factor YcaO